MPRYAMVPSYKNNARFCLPRIAAVLSVYRLVMRTGARASFPQPDCPQTGTPLRLQFQLRVHVLLVISSSATASTFRLWGHGLVASGQL